MHLIVGVGCDEPSSPTSLSHPLHINEISTQISELGTVISITGHGFGIQGVEDAVYIARQTIPILSWNDQSIEILIPTSFGVGFYYLVVYADGFYSEAMEIEIIATK